MNEKLNSNPEPTTVSQCQQNTLQPRKENVWKSMFQVFTNFNTLWAAQIEL